MRYTAVSLSASRSSAKSWSASFSSDSLSRTNFSRSLDCSCINFPRSSSRWSRWSRSLCRRSLSTRLSSRNFSISATWLSLSRTLTSASVSIACLNCSTVDCLSLSNSCSVCLFALNKSRCSSHRCCSRASNSLLLRSFSASSSCLRASNFFNCSPFSRSRSSSLDKIRLSASLISSHCCFNCSRMKEVDSTGGVGGGEIDAREAQGVVGESGASDDR